jgi:RNA polymerase sigma-70 factor (ECF subfamily)
MIDQDLIERCRRGDRSAQHEVYIQTADRLYRLLLRVAGNSADAEDLAQEAYIRAFTRIAQFDGRSSFYTWLCRIAINQALQHGRRPKLVADDLDAVDSLARPDNGDPADTRFDVEDALAKLPALDRSILLLRYQEGLDYRTIAEVTGCPSGTVASRLNRARDRIRELFKKGSYDQGRNS